MLYAFTIKNITKPTTSKLIIVSIHAPYSTAATPASLASATVLKTTSPGVHIFPKQYLINNGYTQKAYNQIANFVYAEQATNIIVGEMPPNDYLDKIRQQIKYGNNQISTLDAEYALIVKY